MMSADVSVRTMSLFEQYVSGLSCVSLFLWCQNTLLCYYKSRYFCAVLLLLK